MQAQRYDDYDCSDPLICRLSNEAPALLDAIRQQWLQLERGIVQTYPEQRAPGKVCEVVPRDLRSYIQHVVEMTAAEDTAVTKWLHYQHVYSGLEYPPSHLPTAFDGRTFGDSRLDDMTLDMIGDHHPNHPLRSPTLSELTVWQRWAPPFSVPWRPLVAWPCLEEMSWEGDQRVASENGRYGRFPALPRRGDYQGHVPWQQRAFVKPWEFDNVWHVPDMDDVYLGVEQVEPEVVPDLLNTDLVDAMDSEEIPVPVEKVRARIATMQRQFAFS